MFANAIDIIKKDGGGLMPKSSLGRWVSMFVVLLGKLHISLVNLLKILFSFFMYGLENGTA